MQRPSSIFHQMQGEDGRPRSEARGPTSGSGQNLEPFCTSIHCQPADVAASEDCGLKRESRSESQLREQAVLACFTSQNTGLEPTKKPTVQLIGHMFNKLCRILPISSEWRTIPRGVGKTQSLEPTVGVAQFLLPVP